jgi:Chaseviridae HNH endonuclease
LKEPWEKHPELWKTEAAFWAYLRGGIRLIWSRYPAKLKWKSKQLAPPPPGYIGRAKKVGQCSYCQGIFAASSLEVDHVSQAGGLNSWASVTTFVKNLLDTNNNWVLACKPCHKIKSYQERAGVSFSAARAEKRAIEFLKKPVAEVLDFCKRSGYNTELLTNASKRRACLVEIFKKDSQ